MSNNDRQITNPFSSGGGGGHFEAYVQASFVVLILTGGFAPCMPFWPIIKIKLQGKFAGYDTDDLIVYVEKAGSGQQRKILGQIKHAISITESDKVFGEVIHAAWKDFNNASLFSQGRDAIALITGPLNATDVSDARTILEWARHSENHEEFFNKVELAHFSSQTKQAKLQAFKTNLKNANGGEPLSEKTLFDFLRHFHLLGYDLDVKAGTTLSLLHSLIGQYAPEDAHSLWTRIVDEVQFANKNAGTISLESLPDDLKTAFTQRPYAVIPDELSESQLRSDKPDWNQFAYASDMAVANLIGSWNEQNEADLEIIRRLINEDTTAWIPKIREVLQEPASPISLKNGKWSVTERKSLWKGLGARLFDENLDRYKEVVVRVLSERDPQFELGIEDRFAASIHGKVLNHSPELRKGLAESLALLGNLSDALTNCSQFKPETIASMAVRKVFENADWVLWGSLNRLLPILAEASPDEFLSAVEGALRQSPCPFDQLFSQEGYGVFGGNYLTGLLWALEALAWEEPYLVRVCVILGEIATHDPGGNWANRPANSLTTIFLPWLPQTTASVEKRKVAIQTLLKEFPMIGWKLLLSLLPNQHQMSTGSYKPLWRNSIPDDWERGGTQREYWDQVSLYADLTVEMASHDKEKLSELVGHLNNLPHHTFDNVLELLSSEDVYDRPEDERLALWNGLTKFTRKHRRLSEAEWALSSEIVSKIEGVADKLAPTNLLNLHLMLFTDREFDLYEENENWEEQRQKLNERRIQALQDILDHSGIEGTIQFAQAVESPLRLGRSLGTVAKTEIDPIILPALLDTDDWKFAQFVGGYTWGRHNSQGWAWVDGLDKSAWSALQISQWLSYLPFTEETWNRATAWLGDSEGEYWIRTNVNPYQADCDLGIAVDKLIAFGRPHSAIDCLFKMHHDQQPLDKHKAVLSLLAAASSEEPTHSMDVYHIVEIIKDLQNDPDTDPEDLFQVEWVFLPLLDQHNDASPKHLDNRLASDPAFFCEVIRLVYRSRKEEASEKEVTEKEKSIASNAWRLLHEWRTPPGVQPDGVLSTRVFTEWLDSVKETCNESGHLEVAHTHIGQVLIHCPPDTGGLWIDQIVADALNARDADEMRNGFRLGFFNMRGVHMVDPTGRPERDLAEQYRLKAEEVENAGYQRLAATLRDLAETYDRHAELIVAEHNQENRGD